MTVFEFCEPSTEILPPFCLFRETPEISDKIRRFVHMWQRRDEVTCPIFIAIIIVAYDVRKLPLDMTPGCLKNHISLTLICRVDYSILVNWTSPFLFFGCLMYCFHFHLFFIEIPVSKQWRPWSDAAFCSIWSVSALFAYVPKVGR